MRRAHDRRQKDADRRTRFALTLLYAFIVFAVLLLAVAVSAGLLALLVYSDRLENILNTEMNAMDMLVFMGVVSLAIGGVLALVTSRIPLRPINRIINRLNRLASGDYSVRLRFGRLLERHPTMCELTDSFNKLACELESTELLRSDFVDNFSHEFKTPIVSIAGFAKLLRRGNLTGAQRDEYLAVIEEESLRLAALATNVLNMTHIENRTILTDVSEYNLSEQLRACVLLLEDKWAKKELDFRLEFDEHTVTAGEELMKHVWINLIDNAVKFSVDAGTIDVRIRADAGGVSVAVTNEGPAIAPEIREKIFRKFYQGDESHASEGSGVGLAVVRRVVDLHGGEVRVDCDSGYTTFTVRLPQPLPSRA